MKKHKKILDEFAEYFVSGSIEKGIVGCVANGIPESVARKVWADMEKFAGYAFNKSHAVAYSMHTVRTAWLAKNYYPEYMTAVLNANIKKADKIRGYISVCKQHGLQILPPSINDSESDFSTNGKIVRFGLGGLKNVGSASSDIIHERKENGAYTSYKDFLLRMAKYKMTSRALESLIYAGCLDEFDLSTRQAKIDGLSTATSLLSDIRQASASRYTVLDMLGGNASETLSLNYDKDVQEMSKADKLRHEDEIVGFYMSGHPMDDYVDLLKDASIRNIFDVVKDFNVEDEEDDEDKDALVLRNVTFAGIIKECERKLTKKGDPWWTLTVEDQTGLIKATYFNRDGSNRLDIEELLRKNSLVQIQGTVKDDGYGPEMSVEYVAPLSKYLNVTQATHIDLIVHPENTEYSFKEFGRASTMNTLDYVKSVLNDKRYYRYGKGSEATIEYVVMDEQAYEVDRIVLGDYSLKLEQYVKLQRCLGAANVVPTFLQNKRPD